MMREKPEPLFERGMERLVQVEHARFRAKANGSENGQQRRVLAQPGKVAPGVACNGDRLDQGGSAIECAPVSGTGLETDDIRQGAVLSEMPGANYTVGTMLPDSDASFPNMPHVKIV